MNTNQEGQTVEFVCTNCRTVRTFTKPENAWMLWMGWVMIVLSIFGPPLVFLLPPGVVLVVMAYRQRKPTCVACKSRNLIPTSTPMGGELTAIRHDVEGHNRAPDGPTT